ncbi:MAG: HepT-like ribonuclease domain-containing protein, partial [Xanthobacteraceae bacterium]
MPSDNPILRLEDILANIELIQAYTRGYSYDDFVQDLMCQDAMERCVSRISEAASKLEGSIEGIIPDQPWLQIRAVGNVLRHEYDRANPIFIWK